MFIRYCVIFLAFQVTTAQRDDQHWDLAVVTEDKIELLLSNGSLSGEPFGHFNEFTKLKALTFDNVRHEFIVSDMDQQNDTIFAVQLTKETDIKTIVEDLPDDVQGLALDPISDILYWTDSINKTINYVHLNDSKFEAERLFGFDEGNPQDITLDACRRYLYWTNSDINRPTIERSKLDGSDRQVLVDTELHRPAGITIDYQAQRLLWTDIKEGIYYSIESTNLDGQDRQVVYEGTHSKPFGIATTADAIFWTDTNNNVLWKLSKTSKEPSPQEVRHFKDKPMGIIAKDIQIKALPDCEKLKQLIAANNRTEVFRQEADPEPEMDAMFCFNGGYVTDEGNCHCLRGFAGKYCEVSLCHNYCVHGKCYTSALGYPQCHCLKGFGGKRCERDMCDGFCLNGGECSMEGKLGEFPVCKCREEFTGARCESSTDFCESFCQEKSDEVLMSEKEVLCRCVDGSSESPNLNMSLPLMSTAPYEFFDHFQDTAFLVLCCLVLILLVTIVFLAAYTCSLRKRPRIKKRIIVNKNVTPLTYRPQPATEQCEITIENCCNMNICETPCFEPPKLPCIQTKNDDKKKLLSNMENGEEFY